MRFVKLNVLAVAFVITTSAAARQIESWPYERLFKEADLIVIASAEETTTTEDRASGVRLKDVLIGQNTTFKVISVLKGKTGDGPLTILHFKVKDGIQNMNGLVAFRTKPVVVSGGKRLTYEASLGTPQYLLFLKVSEKGRFEPLSGQTDPRLSVREIYAPLPEVMDEQPPHGSVIQR